MNEMSKTKGVNPTKRKKKKISKVEGVNVHKAEGGFVIEAQHEDYEDNQSHVSTSKKAMTELVNSLLG